MRVGVIMRKKNVTGILLAAVLLAGCTGNPGTGAFSESNDPVKGIVVDTVDGKSTTVFAALDTVVSMTVYGSDSENAVKAAADLIDRMEKVLSTELEDSELHILNENGSASCSEELTEAITLGQEYGKETDGAFNIALYPIDEAWGFFDMEYRVPEKEEIENLLLLARPEDAKIIGNDIVYGTEGMKLDLGGIGKGYIADKISELFSKDYPDGVKA